MAGCGEIQPEPAAATGTSVNPTASVAPDAGSTPAARPSGLGDAGPEAGLVQDDGGVAAEYGAPPDAGFDDDGGVSADYGQPPVFLDGGHD